MSRGGNGPPSRLVWSLLATLTTFIVESTFGATGIHGQQPTFSSRVVGVRVDVLVTDRSGKPLRGLTADEFELRDNGVVQKIDVSASTTAPINIVLALDTSASTTGKPMNDLQTAIRLLLDSLGPADRVALTTFSHAVVPRVPLTSDVQRLRLIANHLVPSGETSLLDGIYAALMATENLAERSVVVICTDERDTTSWLTADEILEAARRLNAVVYVIASAGARRWPPLKALSEATGGRVIDVDSSAQIAEEFHSVLEDFRSRYVLTFTPAGVPPGGFHRLNIGVRDRSVKVTARPGYFGEGGSSMDSMDSRR